MASSLHVAVVGASGYSGEELVRLLARHPHAQLKTVTSRQFAGQTVGSVVPGLAGTENLVFENLSPSQVGSGVDLVFLALPHGVAAEYAVPLRQAGIKVVDLSADFRLKDPAIYQEFYGKEHPAPALLKESVYGLPELHRAELKTCDLIASPGCYPTSIILALAPFLKAKAIDPDSIVINSLSGVSGAGKKAEISLLYSELDENMKPYGVPKHRHLSEIEQELALAAGEKVVVTFIPHLVPLHRGMLSTIITRPLRPLSEKQVFDLLQNAYEKEPFVQILPVGTLPEVKFVARTNRVQIGFSLDNRTGRLMIFSALDNLGKGAAGQAVQAMNVRAGLEESAGL
jgi:N-acetyl-gamma-glutamyl-phosphate reductase